MLKHLTVLSILLFVLACEKDEFSKAPSAKAPKTQGKAQPMVAPSNKLPPNHPPVTGDIKRADPLKQGGGMAMPSNGARPSGDGKSGPLRWTAPEGWQASKPQSKMRLGEYIAPGPKGVQPAVMSIFYFGPQGGGGVKANIDRWVGQFTNADGSAIKTAKQATKTIGKVKVHMVDVTGTYGGGMGGGGAQKDYRVMGAIAESPAGLFFFKLLGPAATMKANEQKFESFVQSMKVP